MVSTEGKDWMEVGAELAPGCAKCSAIPLQPAVEHNMLVFARPSTSTFPPRGTPSHPSPLRPPQVLAKKVEVGHTLTGIELGEGGENEVWLGPSMVEKLGMGTTAMFDLLWDMLAEPKVWS